MAPPTTYPANIFGIHEPGGEKYMKEAGHPGWILFTEGIGHNPLDMGSRTYTSYSSQGFGIMVRLNNGYAPDGTIPHSSLYADFARRCANFVAGSNGCRTWIIGNEMNYALERPQSARRVNEPAFSAAQPGIEAGDDESGEAAADADVVGDVDETPIDEATVSSGSRGSDGGDDAGQSGGFFNWIRRLVTGFLRGVSGGMGDAQLRPEPPAQRGDENGAVSGATPGSEPVDRETSSIDSADPFNHGNPQRFNALHIDNYNGVSDDTSDTEADDDPDDAPGGVASDAPRPLQAPAASQVITPDLYVDCYMRCRDAIHAVPGHENDQVLIGAVAPWNNQTAYPGNPNGDWVIYFRDILNKLGADRCDGITIHTYTHQADPNLIRSEAKMNPPFQNRHYEFRAYQDFMFAIPSDMRHLPVYITETDQNVSWYNDNIGWVQQAYGEIDYWNRQSGNQQIRALILYRWPQIDRWYIEGKGGVIADFRDALVHDYRWRPQIVPNDYKAGDLLATTDMTNLRKTPGYIDQAADDVITVLPLGARVTVQDDNYRLEDSLVWWRVETAPEAGSSSIAGWIAQNTPAGVPLLHEVQGPGDDKISVGGRVRVVTYVRMRSTPGYRDKPADDVVADLAPGVEGTVMSGPESVDDLVWWHVRTVGDDRRPLDGWMAESDPNGTLLLEPIEDMEPPSVPGNGSQDGTFKTGDAVITVDYVRVRRSPGYVGKTEADVVQDVLPGTSGVVLSGPQAEDDLTWWQIRLDVENGAIEGWAAEVAPNGVQLLEPLDAPVTPLPGGPDASQFKVGELVQAASYIRVRRSPGYVDKPEEDTLGEFAPPATLNIVDGPREADGLTWWRVGGISESVGELIGWIAETAPNGIVLMQQPPKLPGTDIPNAATGLFLGAPFRQPYGISQLWGENPQTYSQFSYDGVPLRGHNGIDFLTPTGTDMLAVDDGVASEVVYEDLSGFGHYVKLQFSWGEAIYAHLNDISVVQGQAVRRGELIGHSGSTGYSGGPHLHFAIRINPYERTDGWGGFSDPLPYMDPDFFYLPSYVLPWTARASAAPAPEADGTKPSGFGLAPDHPDVVRP